MPAAPGPAAPATDPSAHLTVAVPSDLKRSSSSIDSILSTPSTEQSSWCTGDTDGGLEASTSSMGVQTLLYEAQLDLIAHKPQDAIARLEKAVALGSSAACATVANLLARGWRADFVVPTTSPPTEVPPCPGRFGRASGKTRARPAPPARLPSNTSAYSASPSRNPDALRAIAFFLKGLDLELEKPSQAAIKPSGVVCICSETASDDEDSDDEGVEGRFFDLGRMLDLLTGVTDAHRYNILHAPELADATAPSTSKSESLNDSLWYRSNHLCRRIVCHPDVAPALFPSNQASELVEAWLQDPTKAAPSPNPQQPAETVCGLNRQRAAVAISALYVLALQAWATPGATCSSTSPPWSPPSETALTAQRYWTATGSIAAPFIRDGGLGIKQADELVERARHRLDSLNQRDLGADEPWRQAKKRRSKTSGAPRATGSPTGSPAGLMLLQQGQALPAAAWSASSASDSCDREEKRSASFHLVDEGGSSGPPNQRNGVAAQTVHSASQAAPQATDAYPSPPQSPIGSSKEGGLPARKGGIATSPKALQPPSALECAYTPDTDSAGLGSLPRATSMRSIRSNFSTASALSAFRHNPLEWYASGHLRRVPSSVSICTAPPDFTDPAARYVQGKGKGRLVEPGEALDRAATSSSLSEESQRHDRPAPKTWLSRFWSSGKGAISRPLATGPQASISKHSASERLREALYRHEQAYATAIDYWGETEFLEEEEGSEAEESLAPPAPTSEPSGRATQAENLRASLSASGISNQAGQRATRHRNRSGHRSFALTDPTAFTSTASSSRGSSLQREAPSADLDGANSSSDLSKPSQPTSPKKAARPPRSPRKKSDRLMPHAVPMDPLLLELEQRSRVGVKTVCAACGKKGLNFPACRTCQQTYCSRLCRTNPKHASADAAIRSKQAVTDQVVGEDGVSCE